MSILGILGDIGVDGLVLAPDTRLSLWLVPMGDLVLEPAESRLAFDREGWTAGLKSPLCDFFLLKRPIFGQVSIREGVRYSQFGSFVADSQIRSRQ